jgi:hypothetical protein
MGLSREGMVALRLTDCNGCDVSRAWKEARRNEIRRG